MEEKTKITQGQRKAKERIKELLENDVFNQEFQKIKSIKNPDSRANKIVKFAEKYFLDYEPGSFMFNLFHFEKFTTKKSLKDYDLDLCKVYDLVDEYLNPDFPADFKYPPSSSPSRSAQIRAFPIHIGINPFATKRDVMDFISKRWDYIRYMLDYHVEKPKIIKIKKKSERDSLIWNHRKEPASEIAKEVNKKFPDENMTYSDIHKILYYLRKRKQSS